MRKLVNAIYDLVDQEEVDGDAKETTTTTKSQRAKIHAEKIFKTLDADRNGSIDVDEFVQGVSSDPQLMKMLAPINFD